MVSLSGLEEELIRLCDQKGWAESKQEEGPPLAVAAAEQQSEKPHIVVFSTFQVSKDQINDALRESGFGRIIKVTDVRQLEQIPLTGTGKVQYRALEEMLTNSTPQEPRVSS